MCNLLSIYSLHAHILNHVRDVDVLSFGLINISELVVVHSLTAQRNEGITELESSNQ